MTSRQALRRLRSSLRTSASTSYGVGPSIRRENFYSSEASSSTMDNSAAHKIGQLNFCKLASEKKNEESPLEFYERLAKAKLLLRDSKQLAALSVLDAFHAKVVGGRKTERERTTTTDNRESNSSSSWLQKLWERSNKPDNSVLSGDTSAGGVYLFGGPGSGKTFIADLFFATLPREYAKRAHFHAFMMETHSELHRLAQTQKKSQPNVSSEDTVKWFADSLASEIDVLFLDEFQVTDVADAMIIRRLLDRLWEKNVRVVCTSNRAPDELYKNGLNRKQFLPCIEGIKTRMKIHDMDSSFDYRMFGSLNIHGVWKAIVEDEKEEGSDKVIGLEEAKKRAHNWLKIKTQNVAGERKLRELEVAISGRCLKIMRAGGGVARIEFDELCNANLGPSDYVALCSTFHCIGLENIPQLSMDRVDLMRRFITFIDCAYEHKVKLVITAFAKHPDDLLVVNESSKEKGDARDEFFAWDRAKSRLNEMQTDEYTKSSWRPKPSKWLLEQSFSLKEKNENVLRGLWQRYDKTQNRVLDESELAYLLADLNELRAGHRHVSQDQLKHFLIAMTRRRCGTRCDGFVTYEDFIEYGIKGFDLIELPPTSKEGRLIPL